MYRSRYGRDKRPDCRTKVVVAGGLIVFGLYLDCEQSLFCSKAVGKNATKNTAQVSCCERTSVICERLLATGGSWHCLSQVTHTVTLALGVFVEDEYVH